MTDYAIGITTYDYRFEKYFVKLVDSIRLHRPNLDIIVSINGNYNENFNEEYRKKILHYCSINSRIYPIIFPEFRCLSKLWNTCLIHSPSDKVLILNDDISILSAIFFDELERHLSSPAFKINKSWSHYFIDRKIVDEIGWFDERLLGLGEEDGDFEFRYETKYQHGFPYMYISNIINHVEHDGACKNMRITHNKYSAFNREFMFNYKYKIDNNDGTIKGMTNMPLKCIHPTPVQYVTELFYWNNKHLL